MCNFAITVGGVSPACSGKWFACVFKQSEGEGHVWRFSMILHELCIMMCAIEMVVFSLDK